MKLLLIDGLLIRMQVKCVGRRVRRELITIVSIRRHADRTESSFLPNILMSSETPCLGIVISVRVSLSIRFFTTALGPIIAPKNGLISEKINEIMMCRQIIIIMTCSQNYQI